MSRQFTEGQDLTEDDIEYIKARGLEHLLEAPAAEETTETAPEGVESATEGDSEEDKPKRGRRKAD